MARLSHEERVNKKLGQIRKEIEEEFITNIERNTAEKLMQTLYRKGLLKLELRDIKTYLDEYFR